MDSPASTARSGTATTTTTTTASQSVEVESYSQDSPAGAPVDGTHPHPPNETSTSSKIPTSGTPTDTTTTPPRKGSFFSSLQDSRLAQAFTSWTTKTTNKPEVSSSQVNEKQHEKAEDESKQEGRGRRSARIRKRNELILPPDTTISIPKDFSQNNSSSHDGRLPPPPRVQSIGVGAVDPQTSRSPDNEDHRHSSLEEKEAETITSTDRYKSSEEVEDEEGTSPQHVVVIESEDADEDLHHKADDKMASVELLKEVQQDEEECVEFDARPTQGSTSSIVDKGHSPTEAKEKPEECVVFEKPSSKDTTIQPSTIPAVNTKEDQSREDPSTPSYTQEGLKVHPTIPEQESESVQAHEEQPELVPPPLLTSPDLFQRSWWMAPTTTKDAAHKEATNNVSVATKESNDDYPTQDVFQESLLAKDPDKSNENNEAIAGNNENLIASDEADNEEKDTNVPLDDGVSSLSSCGSSIARRRMRLQQRRKALLSVSSSSPLRASNSRYPRPRDENRHNEPDIPMYVIIQSPDTRPKKQQPKQTTDAHPSSRTPAGSRSRLHLLRAWRENKDAGAANKGQEKPPTKGQQQGPEVPRGWRQRQSFRRAGPLSPQQEEQSGPLDATDKPKRGLRMSAHEGHMRARFRTMIRQRLQDQKEQPDASNVQLSSSSKPTTKTTTTTDANDRLQSKDDHNDSPNDKPIASPPRHLFRRSNNVPFSPKASKSTRDQAAKQTPTTEKEARQGRSPVRGPMVLSEPPSRHVRQHSHQSTDPTTLTKQTTVPRGPTLHTERRVVERTQSLTYTRRSLSPPKPIQRSTKPLTVPQGPKFLLDAKYGDKVASISGRSRSTSRDTTGTILKGTGEPQQDKSPMRSTQHRQPWTFTSHVPFSPVDTHRRNGSPLNRHRSPENQRPLALTVPQDPKLDAEYGEKTPPRQRATSSSFMKNRDETSEKPAQKGPVGNMSIVIDESTWHMTGPWPVTKTNPVFQATATT